MNEDVKVKSLAKALRLLEMFIEEPVLGVTEIALKTELNKSNVSDILTTFAGMGYVERNDMTGKYQLGAKLLKFAYPIVQQMNVHKAIYPHMLMLAEHLGEMIYLAIPYGKEALYLQNALPVSKPGSYLVRSVLGEKAPLYCTGIGKAMLSRMPEAEWAQRVPERMTRFTENTCLDRDALFRELQMTRERGYAIDDMEHENGVRCVAIALIGENGEVSAGLSVSGPAQRFTPERCEEIARELKGQSRLISPRD